MARDVILGASRCTAALNDSGLMMVCRLGLGHDGAHATHGGIAFGDSETWPQVFAREQEEQERINAEIASRPGQQMTRS